MRVRCNYCGHERHFRDILWRLRFIFSDRAYIYCPRCHKVQCIRNMEHYIHETTDEREKNINKHKLFDERLIK